MNDRLSGPDELREPQGEAQRSPLSNILESITDGFFAVDRDWIVTYLNGEAERVLGRQREDLVGKNYWAEFPFMRGTTYDELLHEVRATRLPMHFEEFCRCCGAWLEVHAYPATDGLSVYFRDISARKRVEQELERLAAFSRFNPDPVVQIDRRGRIVYLNQAADRLVTAFGAGSIERLLPPDREILGRACLENGRDLRDHEVAIGGRTLCWSFFPVASMSSVFCYGADITDRLKLEARVRESQKMESVGQLAGGIAHDFNNLLTAVQGYASLLSMTHDLHPEVAEGLRQISSAADRAAELTRQLLTLGRRRVVQSRLIDLNALIRERLTFIRTLLSESIELEFLPTEGLAPIYADEGLIDQVLMNLVVNARDAMPGVGKLTLATSITTVADPQGEARAEGYVRLTVADSGCGMDAATREHIFEPFFTTKEVGKGSGLGLSIVYGIVKQHSGWIEVASEVGQGTAFNILLPHCRTADPEEREAEPMPASAPIMAPTPRETIFVVEDEALVRTVVARILEQHGYHVLEAANGDEALSIWQDHADEIDLLLTDVVMPGGLNGHQLAQCLTTQKPSLKVIYTSGHNLELVGHNFELRPGLHFVQKPYRTHSLLQALRECLSERTAAAMHGEGDLHEQPL